MFKFALIVLQPVVASLGFAFVAEAQTDEEIDAYVALADNGFELSLAVNRHHRDEPEVRLRVLDAAIESARFQSAELGSLLSARASAHEQLESYSEAADDLAASIPLWEESPIYRNPMEPTLIRHLVRAERYLEAAVWTDRFRGELNRPLSRGGHYEYWQVMAYIASGRSGDGLSLWRDLLDASSENPSTYWGFLWRIRDVLEQLPGEEARAEWIAITDSALGDSNALFLRQLVLYFTAQDDLASASLWGAQLETLLRRRAQVDGQAFLQGQPTRHGYLNTYLPANYREVELGECTVRYDVDVAGYPSNIRTERCPQPVFEDAVVSYTRDMEFAPVFEDGVIRAQPGQARTFTWPQDASE